MKLIITTLIIISNTVLFSQQEQIIGDYTRILGQQEKHIIEYTLTLNRDGTFNFHSYSNIKQGIPPIVNKYGRGKWKSEKNIVTFFADKESDFDEKHTLDFNNSKARFKKKSPRDKTDRIVKTSLQFFESNISWLDRLQIFKR